MAEYIDKTKLISEGWELRRIYQQDAHTMVAEVKKLDDIPAADVAPVRRGRWKKTVGENGVTSACRCSICGFEDNRFSIFSYCPNCGAKMMEDADD